MFDPRAELARLQEQKAEETLAANWLAYYEKLDAPKRAWADILQRQRWDWFVTLTFRPDRTGPRSGMHPEAADKAYQLLMSSINRDLFGKRWHTHPAGGLVWARGQEFHKDGRIHFHALAALDQADLNVAARRLTWMDWWFERFGIARIEKPISQEDICGYVSKYVVKGGEVDVSNNFGRYCKTD